MPIKKKDKDKVRGRERRGREREVCVREISSDCRVGGRDGVAVTVSPCLYCVCRRSPGSCIV